MASAPPQAAGLSGIKQSGYTKLFWGTESLGAGLPNSSGFSYIVTSARASQVVDNVETQQGSGLTAVLTQVIDGQRWEFTVEEDLAITPPPVSTLVTLQNVFVAALGITIAPWGNSAIANTGTFVIENNDFNGERKAVGTRVLIARAYVAMNTVNGGGNPAIGT
jgi:hypothetical protein